MSPPRQDRSNTPAQEAAWLDIAADEKAASILKLAGAHDVKTVIEIGAGSGAVLAALDRRGFAEQYWACEPAAELLAEMQPITRLVQALPTTFDQAFLDQTFDLAILSHVVEHLLAPAPLIAQALQRAKLVFIEIPIEGSVAGNARAWMKERLGRPRLDNEAGHVQFFSRKKAHQLIQYSGGVIADERGYFPIAPYRAQANHGYQRLMLTVARFEPAARLYYEHLAMLCTPAQLTTWRHIYAPPA